jgi:predicted  nucleic acid-binding Zn-ribbon protein
MATLPLLYQVQEIESRVAVLTKSLEILVADPNLLALKGLLEELAMVAQAKETELQRVKTRQRQLDLELQLCQERLQYEEKRLYDGSVTHARELEQIQQKTTEYRGTQSKIEEEILQLMESDEQLTAELQQLAQRRQTVGQEQQRIQAELKQQSFAVIVEKEELQAELAELEPQIPTEWLERYRRIAKAHRGIGIAKVKQDSCGVCHVSLADFHLQQVKRGEDKLQFCENCGRILYYS